MYMMYILYDRYIYIYMYVCMYLALWIQAFPERVYTHWAQESFNHSSVTSESTAGSMRRSGLPKWGIPQLWPSTK